MKENIFILPTKDDSKIYLYRSNGCIFYERIPIPNRGDTAPNMHMYITSNEKIKAGDWCWFDYKIYNPIKTGIKFNGDFTIQIDSNTFLNEKGAKKIVMTTDPKLISDGIQVIPDDFLIWYERHPGIKLVDLEKYNSKEPYNILVKVPERDAKSQNKLTFKEHLANYGYNLGNSVPVEVLIDEIFPEWLKSVKKSK